MATYTGPSIVDYLKSVGQDSSYSYRTTLASKYGITGYTGTAAQNTTLLNSLRSGSTTTTAPKTTTTAPTTTAITSPQLATTTKTPYVAPKTVSPYPVSTIATPKLVATPQETAASSLSSKLQDLYNSTVGESAYRKQQEGIYGIDALTKTQNDLGTQLMGLKNEAAAIPLQLMQGAADRGVTTPMLGRQENSRLRTNAIAALGVSTLLEASKGNLSTALSQVDRVVSQKYDPIREKIAAATHNLNLILNDPKTSLQDKNRAQTQLDAQNNQLRDLEVQEANTKEVYNIATTAASNGQNFVATTEYPSLAVALQAITQAPTKEQALQIAASVGLVQGTAGSSSGTTNMDKILSPTEAKTLGVPYGTTVGQAAEMGITPASTSSGSGGTPSTATERLAATLASYAAGFVAGKKLPDGTPVLDQNGYATPVAWKSAIADAISEGISRAAFIKQYGYLLYTGDLSVYGLTAAEKKLIGAEETDDDAVF